LAINTLKEKVKLIGEKSLGFFLLILLGIFILSIVRNFERVREAEMLAKEGEDEVRKLRDDQEKLKEEIEKVQSEEFVEKQLRDTLGMAKEGEIIIILPEDDIVRKFAPKVEMEEEVLPDPNWKKWVKLFL